MGRGRGVNNAPAWQTGLDVAAPTSAVDESSRMPGNRSYGSAPPPSIPCPTLDKIYNDCTVQSVQDFGVFLAIPSFHSHALCHVSALSSDRVNHPSDFCKVGDKFKAMIIKVEPSVDRSNKPTWKVSASIKCVDQSTGDHIDDGGAASSSQGTTEEPPTMDSIHANARVQSVQDYGLFLALPGYRLNAMCHVSSITDGHLDHPSDAYSVGDTVWCKVTNVEPSTDKAGRPSFKVSASIVAVDQQTGKDKDGEQARGNAGQGTEYMHIQGSSADPALAMMNAMATSKVTLKDDGMGQFNGYDLIGSDSPPRAPPAAVREDMGYYGLQAGDVAPPVDDAKARKKAAKKLEKKEKKAMKKEKKKAKKAGKKEKKREKKDSKKEKKSSKKRKRSDSSSSSSSGSSSSSSDSEECLPRMSVAEAKKILEKSSKKSRKRSE